MGGLFRVNHGSVLIFLTLTLLVLTCLQASGSILTRHFTLVNQSRGHSIFFLRAFSELAGVSLSATISATLEHIKWAMICRRGRSRARFIDFLALQQGTTLLGLLSLAAGAAVPSVKARFWSIIRLLIMVLVPGIGVLIMSMIHFLLLSLWFKILISKQARLKFDWPFPRCHLELNIWGMATSQ
jgi:hypothetical protein